MDGSVQESTTGQDGTITLKKSTMWKIATFVFAGLFIISLGFNMFGGDDGSLTARVVAPSAPSPSLPTGGALVSAQELVDDDPSLGDEDAPVIIVEFSDFQCPFCGRFRSQTFDQIVEEYVDTGKVKFVFRDFPLNSIHPFAQKASEASECADDQDKFWEYHDVLFENQGSLSVSSLKKYAVDLGLDSDEFDECLDSGKHSDEVINIFF